MQQLQRYKVTCLKCKRSDHLLFEPNGHVTFEGMMATNFLAARLRGDGNWGFECSCSNDSRLCKEESAEFDKLVYGTPMALDELRKKLAKRTKEPFQMEPA